MADPQWLAMAKALPAGRSTRVGCCSTDRSMLVTNGKHGFRGHCFRCGLQPFVAHGQFSVDQLARRKAEAALLVERVIRLPADFTTDIPPAEATWLYKAGVGNVVATHYGFGYSPFLRRVILPVYKDGALLGFTARSTINERPKYIERMVSPSETIFLADPSLVLPSAQSWAAGDGPDCVITEDILSAVRVGRCVRRSVSLMGTSASAAQLQHALDGIVQGRIAVWLDPDKAGVSASHRLARTLSVMGHDVHTVQSTRDPKFYSNKEIQAWLTE